MFPRAPVIHQVAKQPSSNLNGEKEFPVFRQKKGRGAHGKVSQKPQIKGKKNLGESPRVAGK